MEDSVTLRAHARARACVRVLIFVVFYSSVVFILLFFPNIIYSVVEIYQRNMNIDINLIQNHKDAVFL